MIIDSQVHIWSVKAPNRPWHGPESTLPDPFGYKELLREMTAAGVDHAILVPPAWEGGRPEFALEGVAKYPERFAVMGRIALDDSQGAARLATWKAAPGMLGLRVAFQRPEIRQLFIDGSIDWLWPAAEEHGIPIMVFAPSYTTELIEIARAHPKLTLIADHMGLYREKNAEAATAIESLTPLADCPNVHVKVSSIPFYSTEPYPYRNLHGALERLIAAFGPQRSFWGTDLTRIWSLTTYRQCVTLFTEELEFLSSDDLEWVMGRGIAQCLGWPKTATI